MKTNFEAWREKLTPEEVWLQRQSIASGCWPCHFCGACDWQNTGFHNFSEDCQKAFLRWANAQAKEEK